MTKRRMRISRYEVLAVIWFIAAGILLFDSIAFMFYMADRAAGRVGGCYTILELLCGFRKPTSWMRLAQLWTSVIMIVVGIVIPYVRRHRHKSATGKDHPLEATRLRRAPQFERWLHRNE